MLKGNSCCGGGCVGDVYLYKHKQIKQELTAYQNLQNISGFYLLSQLLSKDNK